MPFFSSGMLLWPVYATELSIEYIINMERGIFGPRFDNLEKIASALNIEVRQLFDFRH